MIWEVAGKGKLTAGAGRLLCPVYALIFLLFTSCLEEDPYAGLPLRTVIVYMIADNNLDYFALKDINEMEQGFRKSFDGNLIVYIDRASGAFPAHPVLYKISSDNTDAINSEIIKVYGEHNSACGVVMLGVLSDIINEFPAQSYGLVLWSHGTAWYPHGTIIAESGSMIIGENQQPIPTLLKSFGKDGIEELNIQELKESLPIRFEFIIFDACYMGSIEVVFELRDKANYIISSPSVVLSAGYPYEMIVDQLFEKPINFPSIANDFIMSFDTLDGALRTATVSVVKTAGLNKLASHKATIIRDTFNLRKVCTTGIQQFTANQGSFLFDFGDFVGSMTSNFALYREFKNLLENVVVYKSSTQKILNELRVDTFSGLSVFVPDTSNTEYYDFYKTLDWYAASGYHHYFNKVNHGR